MSSGSLIKVKMKNLIAVLEGQEWELVKGSPGENKRAFSINAPYGVVSAVLWR